ncbi:hypothetical protein L3Q82_014607 [Scortum barcoo]|uniref:Uncharacterized protein n=1 Tax=Scortum barcoo TaxID=214431 RepID=A0ACB8VX36_9TELE|nr:hypothetical protein L3Q82_014607 [Scortum barcoo]
MSCRRAVLTLLPKKGNLQDIKNWRPVSLLCVDYKLLSKALANRLRGAMEQVIHQDQTYYCVPGRSMVDNNIYLIRDVLEVSSSLGMDTGLISLDQEKAFDRVEHNFLWKVMEKFGFSAGFVAKIKVLYRDIESVLKGVFKSWALFDKKRCQKSASLHWLLKEPLIHGARLDITSGITPGLTVALRGSGTLCLQQLVDAVGPALSDAVALGSLLGLHSVRVAQRILILQLWRQKLSGKERSFFDELQPGKGHTGSNRPLPRDQLEPRTGRPDRPPARRY